MKRILFLLLLTVSVYGQNPSRFAKIQITGNSNSGTATKVNVQEANGEVNTQTINTGFNKNIGLGGSDVVGANTLLNQYSTTPVDWTATAFNSGQVVFYAGKQWIAKIATVAGDVPAVSQKWEEITFEALANKTTTVDQTIIDGSTNAVSSNAVFDGLALKSNIGHTHVASQITDLSKASVGLGNVDNTSDLSKPLSTATINALATKAPISSVHNPVTIGTANGLSLATQQLSLGLASSGVTGALSGTDWNTFNGKFNTPTGLTTNCLPKWNGSGFGNSSIYELNGSAYSLGNFESKGDGGFLLTRGSSWNIYSTADDFRISLTGVADRLIIDKITGNLSATAETLPAGTNTNQIATTAFVQAAAAARPYKVYTALLTQSGSNIPAVTVIENTLGATISYSLGGTGFVVATSSTTSFTDPNKVFISISNGNGAGFFSVLRIQTNQVRIVQQNIAGANTDGLLQTANFEIRVYN